MYLSLICDFIIISTNTNFLTNIDRNQLMPRLHVSLFEQQTKATKVQYSVHVTRVIRAPNYMHGITYKEWSGIGNKCKNWRCYLSHRSYHFNEMIIQIIMGEIRYCVYHVILIGWLNKILFREFYPSKVCGPCLLFYYKSKYFTL